MNLIFFIFLCLNFKLVFASAEPVILCDTTKGLELINQETYLPAQIEMIINSCDKVNPTDPQVLLLHALFARKKKNYDEAINWLNKAIIFDPKNLSLFLELANTYETAKKNEEALNYYQMVLMKDPLNRAALLGKAAILFKEQRYMEANAVYQMLLIANEKDFDALNGIGWVKLGEKDLNSATRYFEKSLKIAPNNFVAFNALTRLKKEPQNKEAKTEIKQVEEVKLTSSLNHALPVLCEADEGLILLNQANPPLEKIHNILAKCDKNTPNNTSALVLHGLLARHLALKTRDYRLAIAYLEKAADMAEPHNNMPIMELAVTYEWSQNPKEALALYQKILNKNPNDRAALLGKARILRGLYEIGPSIAIYRSLLNKAPRDTEALTGLGETFLTNYEFEKAKNLFNEALSIDPQSPQVKTDLMILNKLTRNILAITGGHYSVPPRTSEGLNVYYFRNLNATDGLTLFATHNTKQIESGFGAGPTLLPNNSLLIGYQHIIPNDHGWQLSYDARQHNALPFEHRLFGSTNWFINQNLEWFGGMRWAFPRPWNTELLISGITAYTPTPFNITLTGFWSFQQIGGYNSSYALDFFKEYDTHLFYAFGPSYLPEQKSWEIHGRIILPLFGNTALVAEGSHYFFNNSNFITAGWRFYWA